MKKSNSLSNNSSDYLIIFYFLIYSLGYVLIHLLLTSTFTFFHFLLDHDLGTINNWLSLNGWEVIGMAKVITFIILINLIKLSKYQQDSFWQLLKSQMQLPSKRILIIVAFIMAIFSSFIQVFDIGSQQTLILDHLFLSSMFGSIIFYGIDILFLGYLLNFYQSSAMTKPHTAYYLMTLTFAITILDLILVYLENSNVIISANSMALVKALSYVLLFVLFWSSIKILKLKIAIFDIVFATAILLTFVTSSVMIFPYLDKYLLILVVHFIFLYFLVVQRQMSDIGIYLVCIVAMLSGFFGIDLVWDNNYSKFLIDKTIPALGIIGIWGISLTYYKLSRI